MATQVSRDYLERAHTLLGEAEEACKKFDWALSILRSAESVEFSLKAIVRVVSSSHKREHDVSGDLANVVDRFPGWFQVKIPRMNVVSRTLTTLSIPAKYGDEMLGVSSKSLFERTEAEAYLSIAKQVYFDCNRLFYEMTYKTT